MNLRLGKRIAPPRFVLFGLVLVAAFAIGLPLAGWSRAAMGAFDLAAAVALVAWTGLLTQGTADEMRQASARNDANRGVLLGLTGLVMVVILLAVAKELKGHDDAGPLTIALVIATLVLAWLFSNTVYALHYAHIFYLENEKEDGEDTRGLEFPHCKEPDYWDFIYFSFTLGMTFQTSDVTIASRLMRRIVTGHTLAAFVFNLGILAFTINSLGGGG